MAVDAVGLLDLIEDRLVLGQQLAAAGDARVVHQDVEIVPERLGELRLRVDQVHDPQVGREPAHVLVEARARDVALGGERPQAFEALLEIRRGLRGSRVACISGWPEEPDSPVHSRGGDGAGAVGGDRRLRGRRALRGDRRGRPASAARGRLAQSANPAAPSSSAPANAIRPIDVECFGILRSRQRSGGRTSLWPPIGARYG